MPPRRKKPVKKKGAAVAPQAAVGTLFSGKKGKKKNKRIVVERLGGFINTLGWLWRPDPKVKGSILPVALRLRQPKDLTDAAAEDEEVEEEEVPPHRHLPAYLIFDVFSSPDGTDIVVTREEANHAIFTVAPSTMIKDIRLRLRDYLGAWQGLPPSSSGGEKKEITNGQDQTDGETTQKKKKKKKNQASSLKLVAPEPQFLHSGRKIWSDSVRLGSVVSARGTGSDDELMKYGPVSIRLGLADLGRGDSTIASYLAGDRRAHLINRRELSEKFPARSQLPASTKTVHRPVKLAGSTILSTRYYDEINELGRTPPKLLPLGFKIDDPFTVRRRPSVVNDGC